MWGSLITAIAGAISSVFGYKTKVAETPEQKEVHAINTEAVDEKKNAKTNIDRILRDAGRVPGQTGGNGTGSADQR